MFKRNIIFLSIIFLIAAAIWIVWANTALITTRLTYSSPAVPAGFDGFTIVQLSDTHDAELGPDNINLVAAIKAADPDMIVITGDLVDSSRTEIGLALSLAAHTAEIAPTYYVNGNHEAIITDSDYALLRSGLENAGVSVLENDAVTINSGSDRLQLIGLTDIGFLPGSVAEKIGAMERTLSAMTGPDFDLVLSHRPELIENYAASGAELVLSGHAHGGQFRLPFVGGVIAPGQGLFPKYDSGLYRKNDTSMIVSRGIGNSIVPFRINNRPEIVVIELKSK